jgi:hypothetical protein
MSVDWMDLPEEVRFDIMLAWERSPSMDHYWCGCSRDLTTLEAQLCEKHRSWVDHAEARCPECGEQPVTGIEVQGIVLVWRCRDGHHWPRFGEGRLHDAAVDFITEEQR